MTTEQRATKRPCGHLLCPLPPLGRVKNLTRAGTLGRSTSEPSTANTRKRPFHSICEPNRRSYRIPKRSQRILQNRSLRWLRASQNASSVTVLVFLGERDRTQPQARITPWVMDSECNATNIISQATTSGVNVRLRRGEHPACLAAAINSRAGIISWKQPKPRDFKRTVALSGCVPIIDIQASMHRFDRWRSSMTT